MLWDPSWTHIDIVYKSLSTMVYIYIYIPIMMRFTMFHISNNLDPNHTILWTLDPPKKNENMKFFESLEILGEHSI